LCLQNRWQTVYSSWSESVVVRYRLLLWKSSICCQLLHVLQSDPKNSDLCFWGKRMCHPLEGFKRACNQVCSSILVNIRSVDGTANTGLPCSTSLLDQRSPLRHRLCSCQVDDLLFWGLYLMFWATESTIDVGQTKKTGAGVECDDSFTTFASPGRKSFRLYTMSQEKVQSNLRT
jgi:hypothetical protein